MEDPMGGSHGWTSWEDLMGEPHPQPWGPTLNLTPHGAHGLFEAHPYGTPHLLAFSSSHGSA